MKIYVEETSLSDSPTPLLHLAKDKKNTLNINKILDKLQHYLVKKNRVNDVYTKQGIYQVNSGEIYKLHIKNDKNNDVISLRTSSNKIITLLLDDSEVEKEIVYQLPYEHIIIPLLKQTYILKNENNTKLSLVIEFIETIINNNEMIKPINYYFEYNSKNDANIPLEEINVFLSLLN